MVSKKQLNDWLNSNDLKVVARGIRTVRKEIDEKEDSISTLTRAKAKVPLMYEDKDEIKANNEDINALIERNEGLINNWLEPSLEKLYKHLDGL